LGRGPGSNVLNPEYFGDSKRAIKRSFSEEYIKHTALNLGQLARDFRYFYYHPDADKAAKEGFLHGYAPWQYRDPSKK
jgi:hypothetical protein